MEIDFDPDKAAVNPLKHDGVTFDEAKVVLLDPYALTKEDSDLAGEQRFVTLGMGGQGSDSDRGVDASWRKRASDFGLEGQPTSTEAL